MKSFDIGFVKVFDIRFYAMSSNIGYLNHSDLNYCISWGLPQ